MTCKEAKAKLQMLAAASRKPKAFRHAERLIDGIFGKRYMPSYSLDPFAVESAFSRNGLHRLIRPEYSKHYTWLIDSLLAILTARGYRTDTMTYQEHRLVGSTEWIGYSEHPHTPLGILKGALSVEEAQKARELEMMQSAFDHFYLGHGKGRLGMLKVCREPLDGNGVTIRDPRVLDKKLLDRMLRGGRLPVGVIIDLCTIPAAKSDDYPFRRELAQS